jgi:hypothetical protein
MHVYHYYYIVKICKEDWLLTSFVIGSKKFVRGAEYRSLSDANLTVTAGDWRGNNMWSSTIREKRKEIILSNARGHITSISLSHTELNLLSHYLVTTWSIFLLIKIQISTHCTFFLYIIWTLINWSSLTLWWPYSII